MYFEDGKSESLNKANKKGPAQHKKYTGEPEIDTSLSVCEQSVDLLTDGTRRQRLLKHKYICASSMKRVNFNGPQMMPCGPWSDIETVSVIIKKNEKEKRMSNQCKRTRVI